MDWSAIAQLIDDVTTKGSHVGVIALLLIGTQLVYTAKRCLHCLKTISSDVSGLRIDSTREFLALHDLARRQDEKTDTLTLTLARIDGMISRMNGNHGREG